MFCIFGCGWQNEGNEGKHIKHGHSDCVFCAQKVGGTEENIKEHNRTQKTRPEWTYFVYSGGDGRMRGMRENVMHVTYPQVITAVYPDP